MFFRMVGRTLVRQKNKMFMIALTIALGVSLATAMMNIMLGVGDKVNRELKTYGANINVVHKDASLLDDLYGLNEGIGVTDKFLNEEDLPLIKRIFWGFNIVDFAPYLDKEVFVENLNKKVKMTGTWFAKHLSLPTGEEIDTGMVNMKNWWEIKGKWLDDNDRDGILAGSLFAGKNDIKLGDKLKVKGEKAEKEFTVKGIFTAGGPEDENIYSTLGSVQELSGLKNKIMKVEVSALTTPDNDLAKKAAQNPNSLTTEEYDTWFCTAYVSAICYQIQDVVRESVAKPIRKVAESEGSILNKTSLLMTLITILSSIGAALGISNLVTASVIERRMEIGLLKAIGAHNWAIVSLILLEILITSILGGILGYFTGLGLAQVIGKSVFGSGIESAPMVIPIISVVVILLALIGSIPAIKYLLRLKPTEVLHGK